MSCVREFLGAALLQRHTELLFVSTASRFSHAAQSAADDAIELGLVQSYKLADLGILTDMIAHSGATPYWAFARSHANRTKRITRVPNPYDLQDLK